MSDFILVWILSFLMMLLIVFFLKFTPDEPNKAMGVRTKKSIANKENWVWINSKVYKTTLRLTFILFVFNGLLVLTQYSLKTGIESLLLFIILFDGIFCLIITTIFYNSKLQ